MTAGARWATGCACLLLAAAMWGTAASTFAKDAGGRSNADHEEEIDVQQLDEILQTQEAILDRLDEVIAEARIVTIRATR